MTTVFTVWEITKYIKKLLQNDPILQILWVKGEISDCKQPASGHIYFTIKDQAASLKCVMFRGRSRSLPFSPRSGDAVLVRGNLSLYEKSGAYQLYVEEMHPMGEGDLNQALLKLKEKLEKEGLFAPQHKKQLPFLPTRIAIITSPTGAVVRDIITTVRRRFPGIGLFVVPVAVQGADSAQEIAAALTLVNKRQDCDVIIVARGGGSIEELWSFNEEVVARAIFASKLPVISAVGHETDFSIADFVADIRAATPTAAAELAVPDKEDLKERINQFEDRLRNILSRDLAREKRYLEKLACARVLTHPSEMTRRQHQSVDYALEKLSLGMKNKLALGSEQLGLAAAKLESSSPLKILSRGYALVEDEEGKPVSRVGHLHVTAEIRVVLQDGSATCEVKKIQGGEAGGKYRE